MPERIRNVYLVVAQRCNLSCGYCYAQGGGFGQEEQMMTAATMERALDRLVPRAGGQLVVSFFGGEPLLNFGLLREAVAYGDRLAAERGATLLYTLTSNGTVMSEEILAFLKAHVAHVAISLDGRAAITDRQRRFRLKPRSVHDTVVATLSQLRQAGIPFGIRATVTESAAADLEATAAYLSELGPAAVRLAPAFQPQEWSQPAFEQLAQGLCGLELGALRQLADGGDPLTGQQLFPLLAASLGDERRTYPCAAALEVVAVAANGDLYPCDHFIGHAPFCMGNVHEQWPDMRFEQVRRRFEENRASEREGCRDCRWQGSCGGECPAHTWVSQGRIEAASPQHCALTHRISERLSAELTQLTADPARAARLRAALQGG